MLGFKSVALAALLMLAPISAQDEEAGVIVDAEEFDTDEPELGDAGRALLGKKKSNYCKKDKHCLDGDKCTKDTCEDGYCKHHPYECPEKYCYTSKCDSYKGCLYEEKKCEESKNKCEVNPTCDKHDGKCKYEELKCKPKPCHTVKCDPYKGCVYTPVVCDKPGKCEKGPGECKADSYGKETCVYKEKECPPANKCQKDGYCDKHTGECKYKDIVCKPKPCHTVKCDPYKGCIYTPVVCDKPGKCEKGPGECKADSYGKETCVYKEKECPPANKCQKDGYCDKHTGECKYKDIVCKPKPCHTVKCDPYKGCVYTPVVCDKPGKCEKGPGECKVYGKHEKCVYDKKECPPPNKCQKGGYCSKKTGECKYWPKKCEEKPCYDVKCDPHEGCVYTKKECPAPNKCQKGGYCSKHTGECKYKDIECPEKPCETLVKCDPHKGCIYKPKVCDDPPKCREGPGYCKVTKWGKEKCKYKKKHCDDGDKCTYDKCSYKTGECKYKRKWWKKGCRKHHY